MIVLNKDLSGSILDIGGGGEGFIGRLWGERVISIDNSQEELDELSNEAEKVLMDAIDLKYDDSYFDNVTFFYSLMYMTAAEQGKALAEAQRVLKQGGILAIWDCEIESAYPNPFLIDVDVMILGEKYSTTYGIVKRDTQTKESISNICASLGLTPIKDESNGKTFELRYMK